VASSGMIFIPHFMKIYQLDKNCVGTDGWTHRHTDRHDETTGLYFLIK